MACSITVRILLARPLGPGLVLKTNKMHQPRRAALIAATSIFFMVIIASNARFASSPPAAIGARHAPILRA
jgi:hypothetical protein